MQVRVAEEPLQKIKVLEVAPVKYGNGEPSKNTYHEFLINYCPMCGRKLMIIKNTNVIMVNYVIITNTIIKRLSIME